MKKIILLLSVLCAYSTVSSQSLLKSDEIIWAGIDFSNAKLIGSGGFNDPEKIVDYYYDEWNRLVVREADKYDVAKFYKKDKSINDFSVVDERNDMPDPDEVVTNEAYGFDENTLADIVSNYNLEEYNSGLGLVYVVESFNKLEEHAKLNVVFFDIATQDILWSKQYMIKPGGFGFRNYWARTIYDTMKESAKDFKKALRKM